MNIFKIKTAGTEEGISFEHNNTVCLVMNCIKYNNYTNNKILTNYRAFSVT